MKKQLLTLLTLAVILTSCSKKESEPKYSLDKATLELNYDKEHQFVIKQGTKDIDESEFEWTSTDETVGEVSASGLFQAHKIGETTIKAVGPKGTLTSVVKITPYSTLCAEPYVKFGASLSLVKSKETRTLLKEDIDALYYKGENAKIINVLYGFTDNSLEAIFLIFPNSEAVVKEVAKFFDERYTYLGEDDEDNYYFSDTKTVIQIGYLEEIQAFTAIYYEAEEDETANIQAAKSAIQKSKAVLQSLKKR